MAQPQVQTIPRAAVCASAATTTLFLTSCANHEITGWLYSFYYHKAYRFANLLQMLQGLDSMLDGLPCAGRFMEPRHFIDRAPDKSSAACLEEGETFMEQHEHGGDQATFVVHVNFRRNATWQGTIQWVDQEKTQSFRSTLELIQLIDEAMDHGGSIAPCWKEEDSADKR